MEVASGHLEYERADADALSAVSTRPLTGQPISLISMNNIWDELDLTMPRDYLERLAGGDRPAQLDYGPHWHPS